MRYSGREKLAFLATLLFIACSSQAFADYAKVAVTPPGTASCESTYYAVFNTIQSAVNSVPSGGTVFVCPGTYAEQVTVTKKIIIQGVVSSTEAAAIIVAPAAGVQQNGTDLLTGNPIAAQLLVTAAATINDITVDGTGNGITSSSSICALDLQGITVQNAAVTLDHVGVRNQIPGGILGSCTNSGEGIVIEASTGSSYAETVETSSVHTYNTNGITANGAGISLTATGNFVTGNGVVSGGPVQNGIQLGYGATGKITLNTIGNLSSGSPTPLAAGILLYQTAENSGVQITSNTVSGSQLPIGLETGEASIGDGVTVAKNQISGAAGDSIDVCTNGNNVNHNTIYGSAQSAVHFDSSCGQSFGGTTGTNNSATQNTIVESSCAGVLDDTAGTGGNVTTPVNSFFVVPFPIAYSTSSCPYVPGDLLGRQTRSGIKVSPIR